MSKLIDREVAKKMTFHTCLLQVLQDRTEDLKEVPSVYRHGVKMAGNRFISEADKVLSAIFSTCGDTEVEQGHNLISVIADKLDEAWEEFDKTFKEEKV